MELMSVTLEVSRLSGWLKAVAPCRVKHRRAHEERMRCVLTEGDRATMSAQETCRSGVEMDIGAHREHVAHVRDAGRVPA